MATSTIKPKKGTTAQWKASERVLEKNEWGVEETAEGTLILRIGDGEHKFLELPKVMDVKELQDLAKTVGNFAGNMQQAASAANTAAQAANAATTQAKGAAEACQKLAAGINSMSDDTTGIVYSIGIDGGKIYLQEVEK
nr:MAG TPA: hyaluronidase [Caudoviricetes sp.]